MKLKLTKIGNSVGMILPKEARDKMKVGTGDRLFLTETPEDYKITPYDPAFGEQMDAARIGFLVRTMLGLVALGVAGAIIAARLKRRK